MRFSLILSFFLLNHYSNASIQKLTNPVLPVNLNPTRIISHKHTFITYLNISEFSDIRNSIQEQLSYVESKKNIGNHTLNLIQQAYTLLSHIDHLLKVINLNKRPKRGLINLGGKVSKWMFGTLDADDGKRINLILQHLDKNDHLLQEKVNEQISLAKEIIIKTNHSLSQVKSNLLLIERIIGQYSERVNDVNALSIILNSLLILEIHLNQIINAMTFANINKIHPSFLPIDSLNTMLQKLNDSYPQNQLVQFKNYYNYYSFLGVQLIFKENRIIFLIHFPILLPLKFNTFFIYTIPIENKIISPQKPYLILNERDNFYQYEENPCNEVESTYFCTNYLRTEEDCIVNIITKNKPSNCSTIPVYLNHEIANQLTTHHILFSTPNQTTITEICLSEKHHKLETGSYLITISTNCRLSIGKEIFSSGIEDISTATVIELPQLNLSLLPERSKKIQLSSLDLEEIKQLTTKVNNQHEMNVLDVPGDDPVPVWIHVLIYLSISSLLLLGVTLYYRLCYPYPYPQKQRISKKEEMEISEP